MENPDGTAAVKYTPAACPNLKERRKKKMFHNMIGIQRMSGSEKIAVEGKYGQTNL